LEFCDGTLDDFIQKKENISSKIRSYEFYWLLQMARGVEHIHQNKLVHRDIKPENVLMSIQQDQTAVLKISDFGFCKPTSERGSYSQVSGVKGTPLYMAPEILNSSESEKGTLAADVFSLGCVFAYLVGGAHPFGNPGDNIMLNICTGNAVNLESIMLRLVNEVLSNYSKSL
jgi:serine/threonine protein kinase